MALEATIDLTVKKPDFKSMKSEIKELTVAAQQAVMQFGAFSPEAIRAEQALAGARDRMEDFNDRVKAVNPDKFAQINTVVQGAARGFQAAQGAMALFGSESEELQKTMVKLQGAMALAEGLEGLGKVQQQFGAIAGNIKGNVIKAFKSLGNMSTLALGGIGIVLTLIIANFDTLKKAVMSLIPGLGKMATFVGGLVQKFTDFVGVTSASDRALEKLNKTTDKTNAQLDREIALLQARGDQVGVFNKQRQKLENDLALARANYGKNTEKEWGKIILDTKNALEILKIEEKKFNDDRAKASGDAEAARLKAIQDKKDQAANGLVAENAKNKKHEEDLQNTLSTIKGAGLFKQGKQLKTYTAAEYKTFADQAAAKKLLDANGTATAIQNELDVANAKNELVNASRDALNALGGLFKQGSAAAKTAALADIAIGTGLGFINALDIAQKGAKATGPAAPFAFPIFYASQIAAVLGAASRAKAILKGGSGGGGGSSAPVSPQGLPQVSAPNVSSSLPSVSGFDTKVFVTEGDIRRTQTRVDSLQKVSVVK